METDSIFALVNIAIKGTYYFRVLPYKWDTDTRRLYFVTEGDKWYWWITQIVTLSLKIIAVSKYAIDVVWFDKFHMDRPTDIVNMILMSVCALSAYFDYHFIRNSQGLLGVVNDSFHYLDKFTDTYAKKQEGRNSILKLNLAAGVTSFLVAGLVYLGAVTFPLSFFMHADSHIIAPLYSVRHLVGWNTISSIAITILLSISQMIIGFYVAGSFIYLTLFASSVAIFSVKITNESSADEDHGLTIPELRNWNTWTLSYQTWQILTTDINRVFSNNLLAVVFGFFLFENVLILFTVISVDLPLAFLGMPVIYQVVLLAMYFAFLLSTFKRTENSTRALIHNPESYQHEDGYKLRYLKSFRPVQINLGPFAKINSETLFLFLDIIISQTVDLIIFSRQRNTA